MNCRNENNLRDLIMGDLPEEQIAEVKNHIQTCESCRELHRDMRLGADAMKTVLEVEGKSVSDGFSLAPKVMARIRSERPAPVSWKPFFALAASLILFFVLIGDFNGRKIDRQVTSVKPTIAASNGDVLVVDARPDRLNVQDRVGGITRKIAVKP